MVSEDDSEDDSENDSEEEVSDDEDSNDDVSDELEKLLDKDDSEVDEGNDEVSELEELNSDDDDDDDDEKLELSELLEIVSLENDDEDVSDENDELDDSLVEDELSLVELGMELLDSDEDDGKEELLSDDDENSDELEGINVSEEELKLKSLDEDGGFELISVLEGSTKDVELPELVVGIDSDELELGTVLGVVSTGIELDILDELVSLELVGIELDGDDTEDDVDGELTNELVLSSVVEGVLEAGSRDPSVGDVVGSDNVVGIDDDTVDGVDSLDENEDVSLVDWEGDRGKEFSVDDEDNDDDDSDVVVLLVSVSVSVSEFEVGCSDVG